jgi:CelD/BcsL family acetyltransferase involved in cellulose biosynthesis
LVWLGGKHVNYNQGLFAPELMEALNERVWQRILSDILQIIEPDHVCLLNQPISIEGQPNPLLAITHRPSPSPAFAANIEGTPEVVLSQLRNRMSRKKLRRNLRRLEEEAGTVSLVHATSDAEIATALQQMWQHRRGRGNAAAIPSPEVLDFLTRAAKPGADGEAPAIEIYALKAGDQVVATFGCAVRGGRASGMFISHDCTQFAQSTPGDLILAEVVTTLCVRGFHTIDLGVGDFEYKRRWCDIRHDLFEIVAPHKSAKGHLAVLAISRWLDAKTYIKQHPGLHSRLVSIGGRLLNLD